MFHLYIICIHTDARRFTAHADVGSVGVGRLVGWLQLMGAPEGDGKSQALLRNWPMGMEVVLAAVCVL